MKRFKPAFWPAIIWLIISTILLCLPGSKFPKNDWAANLHLDKLVHIIMFGVLMISWCWALTKRQHPRTSLRNLFLIQALLWIGYGIGMEFLQGSYVPRRDFEFGDIVADAAGVIFGLLYVNQRFIKKIDPCGNRGRNQN